MLLTQEKNHCFLIAFFNSFEPMRWMINGLEEREKMGERGKMTLPKLAHVNRSIKSFVIHLLNINLYKPRSIF